LRTLVGLEARLYVLSFDAVSWNILKAWVTLSWEFEHSESGVDIGLKRRGMTRLLSLSHVLSHCHRLASACHFGRCLTTRGLASHREESQDTCLEGWNKRNPGGMVSSEACIAWWMDAFFVRKDEEQRHRAYNGRAKRRMHPANEHVR
jgi:hypothetical protein